LLLKHLLCLYPIAFDIFSDLNNSMIGVLSHGLLQGGCLAMVKDVVVRH